MASTPLGLTRREACAFCIFLQLNKPINHMKYYYAENNEKFGPFSIEDLKKQNIKNSTLIWCNGMASWQRADEIDEIKEFSEPEPPPLPRQKNTSELNNKTSNDPTQFKSLSGSTSYKRETDATFIGVLLFFVPIAFFYFTNTSEIRTEKSIYNLHGLFAMLMLLTRIASAFWVNNIAKRQNRNNASWATFAFFFPSIVLIIIGIKDRLPLEVNINESYPPVEKSQKLTELAISLMNEDRKDEALELLESALKYDPLNELALYKKARYFYDYGTDKSFAISLFKPLLNSVKYEAISNYCSGELEFKIGNIETAKIFLTRAKELGNEDAVRLLSKYFE